MVVGFAGGFVMLVVVHADLYILQLVTLVYLVIARNCS
jgi:hypothetical protein